MEPRAAALRFDYRGWGVAVRLEGINDAGMITGKADLSLGGTPKCRITLAEHHPDGAGALSSLARMARAYIDDWHAREHSGETGFTAL